MEIYDGHIEIKDLGKIANIRVCVVMENNLSTYSVLYARWLGTEQFGTRNWQLPEII
jgi:hypothetical protein